MKLKTKPDGAAAIGQVLRTVKDTRFLAKAFSAATLAETVRACSHDARQSTAKRKRTRRCRPDERPQHRFVIDIGAPAWLNLR
ncbi:MAG TPA: hypothetical protein VG077_09130 [Verrucomicrobiae bacterium]|nr:hypothetical protein [Verrucomicrobiae bacterium]